MNSKLSLSTIVKIVNIIFLMILQNYILDCGMGIFGVSFLVFYFLYSVLYGSLQSGIAKMVSIRNQKGVGEHSKHIVKPALAYVVFSSMVVAVFVAFCLNGLAGKLLGMVYPVPVIQILCVVMILAGVTDVLCGYHTGNGNGLVANIVDLLKYFNY